MVPDAVSSHIGEDGEDRANAQSLGRRKLTFQCGDGAAPVHHEQVEDELQVNSQSLQDEPNASPSRANSPESMIVEDDIPEPHGQKRHRRSIENDQPRARKRSRNPKKWIDNVNKAARNAGKSYTTRKGKMVPEKTLGPRCEAACKYKCQQNVSEEDRMLIFEKFYKTDTHDKKWLFISNLVTVKPPAKAAADTASGKNRSSSRSYFLRISGEMKRVCKVMFLNTLAISETMVDTALHKMGDSCGISPDKRGKHQNRPQAMSQEKRESVITHINMFPRVASHFCRANSNKEYLEENVKSVANMFRLYETWATKIGILDVADERQYRDIFNHTPGLNVDFFTPKKDQCEVCFAFNHMTPEEKEVAADEHKEHLRKKDIPRKKKNQDRDDATNSTDFCSFVFDLQKVLFTPKCNAGLLFYHRKLSNYNFTIFDLGKREGYCYCWHENIAKRGSNEIGSCLLDFIGFKAGQGFTKFSGYCDNCKGQNKNRMIYAMLMHAAAKYNVEIVLRFLMKGHKVNEGDSMHALIEKCTKNSEMFVPEDWWKAIEQAKKKKQQPDANQNVGNRGDKPYIVKRLKQSDIHDFHSFVEHKSVWEKNTNNEKVAWDDMVELHFDGSSTIRYKTDFEAEELQAIDTRYLGVGHPINLATHKFPLAYRGANPISKKKYDDLQLYCEEHRPIIPSIHHEFYKSLKYTTKVVDGDFYCPYNLRGKL